MRKRSASRVSVRFTRGLGMIVVVVSLVSGCASLVPSRPAEVSYSPQGVPQGSYRLYDVFGRLQIDGQFDQGRRIGIWSIWDSRGNKVAEVTYVDSTRQGPCRMWFGSFASRRSVGQKKVEVEFSDGLQDGTKRTWWSNGLPKCETDLELGAVIAARCWTGDGEAVSRSEAIKSAHSELEADARYFAEIDRIIEGSIRPLDDGRVP